MTKETKINYLFQLLSSTARSGYVNPAVIIEALANELDLDPAKVLIQGPNAQAISVGA